MLQKLQKPFDELETGLSDMIAYLDSLSETRRYQSPPESWNSVQIFYHLKESENGTASYLSKKLLTPISEVPNGGINSKLRSIVLSKNLRNYAKKFQAPAVFKEMPVRPEYPIVREEYLNARKVLKAVLEKFDKDMLGKAYFKHPIAGRITILQTLTFLRDHFERHREQIYERVGVEK